MNRRRQGLLLLLSGCMELCWISAWGTFLASALLKQSFPLPGAVFLFFLGTLLTVVSKGRGWRVLTVLAIRAGGVLLGALGALHHFFSQPSPFFRLGWLKTLFASSPGFVGWLSILFVLFCAVFIYVRGAHVGTKPTDHMTVCTRFDLGIASFFALFLVHFVIEAKGGVVMGGPVVRRLVIPFFLFSLLGIGLARNNGVGERSFASGSPVMGAVMGFSFVVLVFGTGLALFFLPQLTRAAEIGYAGLKIVSAPLAPVLMGILRFMFQPRNLRTESGGGGHTITLETPDAAQGSGWAWRIAEAAVWVIGVLLVLAAVTVLMLCLWYLCRWLLSRTATGRREKWTPDPLLTWLRRKLSVFVLMVKATALFFRPRRSAAELYIALQKWGRRTGLTRLPQETPTEYGGRMTTALPRLEPEFTVIIDAFNEETYGENQLDEMRLAGTRKALRRLRHPSLWFSRMRLLFVPPGRTPHR
jgi:hypothetical protein